MVHDVHGKSGEEGGGAVISLRGGGASSENILRREFDVLEGDYK